MGYDLNTLTSIASRVARSYYSRVPDASGIDREDLAQEALLAMYRASDRYDPAHSLQPFMARVASNHVSKYVRRHRTNRYLPKDAYGRYLPFVALEVVLDLAPAVANDVSKEPRTAIVPPCHPRGRQPAGYDGDDTLCHNCPDKVSCLPETEKRGLTQWTIDDDYEVAIMVDVVERGDAAVIRRTHEVVLERQRQRVRLLAVGRPIPIELSVLSPFSDPVAEPSRPARMASAPQGVSVPAEPLPEPAGMPQPSTVGPRKMERAIAKVRIGQPFDLDYGHVLVRRTKTHEVCVEIREDGFWLNLNQRTYSSLSTAAKAATVLLGGSPSANRPGNDYFSIARSRLTEIRDAATGAVLACQKGPRT